MPNDFAHQLRATHPAWVPPADRSKCLASAHIHDFLIKRTALGSCVRGLGGGLLWDLDMDLKKLCKNAVNVELKLLDFSSTCGDVGIE